MMVVDRQHWIVWISEGYKQYLPALECDESDFVGRHVVEVVPNTLMTQVIKTGQPILVICFIGSTCCRSACRRCANGVPTWGSSSEACSQTSAVATGCLPRNCRRRRCRRWPVARGRETSANCATPLLGISRATLYARPAPVQPRGGPAGRRPKP